MNDDQENYHLWLVKMLEASQERTNKISVRHNTDKIALVDRFEAALDGISNFDSIPEDQRADRLSTYLTTKLKLYKALGIEL